MNENIKLLQAKISSFKMDDRPEDKYKKYSYSGLSTLKQCPYQFNLTYNEGKRSNDTTLALQLGTLLHYVLEQKGYMIKEGVVDYKKLSDILQNGTTETDEKTKEAIIGLKQLKKIYWETWGIPDSEGRTYDQKIETFLKVLSDEMQRDDWQPYLFEHPFKFVYDNKIILHGFIDRVDTKTVGDEVIFRVVDYKTNKKPYPDKDLATSLQFGIYALAILNEFGTIPEEYQYRLILLDQEQYALTKGWEKRLLTALDKLVKELDDRTASGEWIPKPTPLCHWCNFCATNAEAKEYKNECPYYSLWTPENKTYEVKNEYNNIFKINAVDKTKRSMIF